MGKNNAVLLRVPPELLAQIREVFHGVSVIFQNNRFRVAAVGKFDPRRAAGIFNRGRLCHFYADMGIITTSLRPAAAMPVSNGRFLFRIDRKSHVNFPGVLNNRMNAGAGVCAVLVVNYVHCFFARATDRMKIRADRFDRAPACQTRAFLHGCVNDFNIHILPRFLCVVLRQVPFFYNGTYF